MKIGYIRVSTDEQNLGRQEEAMKTLGVERIYSDKASGKTMARDQYQAMRSQLRPGDVIYFDALDRLGRNYAEILAEWKWLTDVAKCEIVCLNPSFMYSSYPGNSFIAGASETMISQSHCLFTGVVSRGLNASF